MKKLVLKSEDCCGCEACVQRCPRKCITLEVDCEGFLFPYIDENLCINCGLCKKVCPVIHSNISSIPIKVFAAINSNEEVRLESSSSGIFSLLGEKILKQKGVVFGAKFDTEFGVIHDFIEMKEELILFRGSKYLQSHIDRSFIQAQFFLKQGRKVLFSGTPCQIAGLRRFLNYDYENLMTVDIICHGVPSPSVWKRYLSENFHLKPSYNISFRDKCRGWKTYCFSITDSLTGEKIFIEPAVKNSFLSGFVAGLFLRKSCYSCKFKNNTSGSDITLGDLWNAKRYDDCVIDDDKGINVVLANTQKGISLLKEVGYFPSIDYLNVIMDNPSLVYPTKKTIKRKVFYSCNDLTVNEIVNRLLKQSFVQRNVFLTYSLFKCLKRK